MSELTFETVLNAAGYYLSGGGGEKDGTGSFDLYTAGPGSAHLAVYLFDDGRWEAHIWDTQVDDAPEHAQARGQGAASLKAYLEGRR
jgi:hypothetical protein